MSIRTKLLIILLVFAVLPAIGFGAWTFRQARTALEEAHFAQLNTVADLKKDKIESYFEERKADTLVVASSFSLRKNLTVLDRLQADPQNAEAIAARETLDRQLQPYMKQHHYDDILLLSREGIVVYQSNPERRLASLGKRLDDQALVKRAETGFAFSEVALRQDERKRVILVAVAPVADLDEKFAGEVVFEIDLVFTRDVVQNTSGLGETGEVVIAQRETNRVVLLFPIRSDPDAALKVRIPLGELKGRPIQNAVRQREGSGIAEDYRGVKVLAAWRYIPVLRWGLVTKMDLTEVFAPITALRNLIVLIGLILIAVALVAAFLTARSITNPISKLKRGTEIISAGNLDHDVATDARDEIGQLSRALAAMTRELKEKIAARHRAEQGLARLVQEFEKANRELNDFAYIVSHDLKAPLRAISTLSGMLAKDYQDKFDDQGREQLELLINRVKRMYNLIEGILQYSRIGRVKVENEDVDLNEVVAQVIELLSPPDHIQIVVENRLPTIRCDRTRMLQIFQNLMGNAIKFMDKPQGVIRVGAGDGTDSFSFYVADNGPGIEEKHFERIFKIFQTLRPRDELESTGIGLAIAKKIVEAYEGKIWLESKMGQGTTFRFKIPGGESQA